MTYISGLTVRQHEREGIEVPVEFTVAQPFATQVRFHGSSGSVGPHVLRGEAIDISSGGMGLRTRQFIPRMCEGTIRVYAPAPAGSSESAGTNPQHGERTAAAQELMFEHSVKVRRVTMTGREPTYSLGVAFISPSPELDKNITALFNRIQGISQEKSAMAGVCHAKS